MHHIIIFISIFIFIIIFIIIIISIIIIIIIIIIIPASPNKPETYCKRVYSEHHVAAAFLACVPQPPITQLLHLNQIKSTQIGSSEHRVPMGTPKKPLDNHHVPAKTHRIALYFVFCLSLVFWTQQIDDPPRFGTLLNREVGTGDKAILPTQNQFQGPLPQRHVCWDLAKLGISAGKPKVLLLRCSINITFGHVQYPETIQLSAVFAQTRAQTQRQSAETVHGSRRTCGTSCASPSQSTAKASISTSFSKGR